MALWTTKAGIYSDALRHAIFKRFCNVERLTFNADLIWLQRKKVGSTGVRRGRAKRAIAHPWKSGLEPKCWVSNLTLIDWLHSCNHSSFVGTTLTLHKSQVHCSGVMQWWVCSSSSPALCLQRWVAKLARGLFCCWSLLGNTEIARNFQRFAQWFSNGCHSPH